MPAVIVENLSFRYPKNPAPSLDSIHLSIAPGEFIGITGPTGAGKSTLMRCVNGVIPHFQPGYLKGKVTVKAENRFLDVAQTTAPQLAQYVGSVFDDPEAQIVSPSVEEEIAFGLENIGLDPSLMEDRISEALKACRIGDLRNRPTNGLSGGQKQRVAIAAALAMRPSLLVLDEPTSELDPQGTEDVFQTLTHLNQKHGITIIIIEQKIATLVQVCHRLIVLNQGRIVLEGPPRNVLLEAEVFERLGLELPAPARLAHALSREDVIPPLNSPGAPLVPLTQEEALIIARSILHPSS